jgi:hypothetical protein
MDARRRRVVLSHQSEDDLSEEDLPKPKWLYSKAVATATEIN